MNREKINNVTCTNCGADNTSNLKYCSHCGYTLPAIIADNVQPPTVEKEKKKKPVGAIVGAIIGVIAVALSNYVVQQIFFKPPSFDKVMMTAASEINKTCPIMIDQYTRLDNAFALDDKLQYNYTLINVEKSQVNPDTVKKYIEPGIINNVRTSPDLKIYRDNKTTMIYNYRDKNGVFILKFSVTPDMYEQ